MEVVVHQTEVCLDDSAHLACNEHPWDDLIGHTMHEQNIGIGVITDSVEHVAFDVGLPCFEISLVVVIEHDQEVRMGETNQFAPFREFQQLTAFVV